LIHKPIPKDIQNIKSYLYKAVTNDLVDTARRVEKNKKIIKYIAVNKYSIEKPNPENALNKEQLGAIDTTLNDLLHGSQYGLIEKPEKLLISAAFWIPRKHREAIVGDIMEDCHELRALGKSKWRIRTHVIWQVVIALILLRSAAVVDAFKRIWSVK